MATTDNAFVAFTMESLPVLLYLVFVNPRDVGVSLIPILEMKKLR